MKRGRLFVISAPSGAGKTSLVRALLAEEPSL
ncbi:MAG: guanylate kinase, partial [Gammaproteobacteria bacterium]|nr:guanylate kinase [Gammaproteobacteria bacterium]